MQDGSGDMATSSSSGDVNIAFASFAFANNPDLKVIASNQPQSSLTWSTNAATEERNHPIVSPSPSVGVITSNGRSSSSGNQMKAMTTYFHPSVPSTLTSTVAEVTTTGTTANAPTTTSTSVVPPINVTSERSQEGDRGTVSTSNIVNVIVPGTSTTMQILRSTVPIRRSYAASYQNVRLRSVQAAERINAAASLVNAPHPAPRLVRLPPQRSNLPMYIVNNGASAGVTYTFVNNERPPMMGLGQGGGSHRFQYPPKSIFTNNSSSSNSSSSNDKSPYGNNTIMRSSTTPNWNQSHDWPVTITPIAIDKKTATNNLIDARTPVESSVPVKVFKPNSYSESSTTTGNVSSSPQSQIGTMSSNLLMRGTSTSKSAYNTPIPLPPPPQQQNYNGNMQQMIMNPVTRQSINYGSYLMAGTAANTGSSTTTLNDIASTSRQAAPPPPSAPALLPPVSKGFEKNQRIPSSSISSSSSEVSSISTQSHQLESKSRKPTAKKNASSDTSSSFSFSRKKIQKGQTLRQYFDAHEFTHEQRVKAVAKCRQKAQDYLKSNTLLYHLFAAAAQSSLRIFQRVYNNFPFLYNTITADSVREYRVWKTIFSDNELFTFSEFFLNHWELYCTFEDGDDCEEAMRILRLAIPWLEKARNKIDSGGGGGGEGGPEPAQEPQNEHKNSKESTNSNLPAIEYKSQ